MNNKIIMWVAYCLALAVLLLTLDTAYHATTTGSKLFHYVLAAIQLNLIDFKILLGKD